MEAVFDGAKERVGGAGVVDAGLVVALGGDCYQRGVAAVDTVEQQPLESPWPSSQVMNTTPPR